MANWPHLPAPPSVGTGAGRQARTMKIKVSFPRRRESVRLQAGAIGEVKVLSQEMLAPDSRR